MKSIVKIFILSILIITLIVGMQQILLSNQYVAIAVGVIVLIMIGMIISELFGLFGFVISNVLRKLLRKK